VHYVGMCLIIMLFYLWWLKLKCTHT